MRYSFAFGLSVLGLAVASCGGSTDPRSGEATQPSNEAGTAGDSDTGNPGASNDGSAHAGSSSGTAGAGSPGDGSHGGGASSGGANGEGGAVSSGGASTGDGGGPSTGGSTGASGSAGDPSNGGNGGAMGAGGDPSNGGGGDDNPPGGAAGIGGGSSGDPGHPPGFTPCDPASRGAVVCPDIYIDTCGEIDTGIVCITTPCPTFEYHDYGNSCEACADPHVTGYWLSSCADIGK